jgi:protein-S-isoprenylcysteine O-methyltransferase Ste14
MGKILKLFMGIVSATPVLILAGIVLVYIMSIVFPVAISMKFRIPIILAGMLLIILGTATVFWANKISKLFHQSLSNMTCFDFMHGPYKFSRHPGALSMIMMLLGLSFVMNSFWGVIVTVGMFLLLTFVFIPLEEKSLISHCSESYLEYKKQVRMWL